MVIHIVTYICSLSLKLTDFLCKIHDCLELLFTVSDRRASIFKFVGFFSGGVTNITLKRQDAQIFGAFFGLVQPLPRAVALMCSIMPRSSTAAQPPGPAAQEGLNLGLTFVQRCSSFLGLSIVSDPGATQELQMEIALCLGLVDSFVHQFNSKVASCFMSALSSAF